VAVVAAIAANRGEASKPRNDPCDEDLDEEYPLRMKNARFVLAVVIAVAVFVAAHFLDFRGSVPNFEKVTGGATLLDMKPSFSEDGIYSRLAEYGERGRDEYAFRNMTVDILLPLGLLPLLLMFMNAATRRLKLGRVARIALLSIPLAYVLLDFAENGAVLALLARFPARLHLVATLLPYLTVVKRTASMLALFGPLVMLGFASLRARSVTVATPGR
jgi:hypothetical protein